jgi:hypothetical protein
MGYLVKHSKTPKIIPVSEKDCLAPNISTLLPSGAWQGQRCFIICGGPSLEGFDFSLIQNEKIIGVNKSFVQYNSTVLYAMDQRMYDSVTYPNRKDEKSIQLHKQWLQYSGIKIFLKNKGKWEFDPSVYVVNNIEKQTVSFDLKQGIYGGNNSGFGAMMLAIALGVKQIYLLGCDMSIDRERKKTHWHDGYNHQKIETWDNILPKFIEEFTHSAGSILAQGISVINLNKNSALNCFPKADIRDIL